MLNETEVPMVWDFDGNPVEVEHVMMVETAVDTNTPLIDDFANVKALKQHIKEKNEAEINRKRGKLEKEKEG